ncbi:MAG: enoyl-CoA hydratase/carnithine racemase [Firmicutes bacterium]|nr:enoyl-CoA hydratase/carnithine racemase [Bacillota bacterium]
MPYENIVLENRQKVQILYINRPKVLNALNEKTLLEIEAAVKAFAEEESLAVMIITGSGDRAFVAGADIEAQHPLDANQGRNWGLLGHRVFRLIETIEKPVIAAINGFALGGGCELAMACDIRLASEKAQLGQPEVTLGITPGYGGTQRLTRLVGEGKAKQLVFTGQKIKAAEAHRIGLVDEIYPPEALLDEAVKMAEVIAANAPLAVRYGKMQISQSLQINNDMATTVEAGLFGLCFATHDQKEGMGAFLEKRKPVFEGR